MKVGYLLINLVYGGKFLYSVFYKVYTANMNVHGDMKVKNINAYI